MAKRYGYIIVIYIITLFSAIPGVKLLMSTTSLGVYEAYSYWSIFSFLLGLAAMLLLLKPEMRKERSGGPFSIGSYIGWIALGILLAFFAQYASAAVEYLMYGNRTASENTKTIMEFGRQTPLFLLVPALIGPILEEIVFRKIIFGWLYRPGYFFVAALASSLIFGVVHGELRHLVVYASMGFVFAYLYKKTNRIIVPIAVHMALNSLTVILQYNVSA